MLDHPKVLGPQTEHCCPIDLGLAAHEVRLLGVEWVAVFILPGLFGVVTIVQENGRCIPVELLLRQEGAALQNQNVLACLGQVQSQCSPSRPGANHNRVILARRVHGRHGIRFTCLKIRIRCHRDL